MRIIIIGGTSAIAEHCTRLWAERGDLDLTLVGRDESRLERVAADLRVRGARCTVRCPVCDFLDPKAIGATVANIVAAGAPDIVLIAHGQLPAQAECQEDLVACRDALEINGVSPALFAEAFATPMQAARHGTLALIGSVAGDRGKRSNYTYGAAKGLLARYAEGLQHRFAGSPVKVVLVKPGPTATPMTEALAARGAKLAPVAGVAREIVRGIERGKPVVYAPARWRVIMLVIRHLPQWLFGRLDI
ncbi:MAG: SDR family NAD(P)-dependent oxidoreductase [Burkholderiales bacterium]|nr:MAG: SDR family NAD(P)-dependent oxidoreductase [Burkholderiales bacterium]